MRAWRMRGLLQDEAGVCPLEPRPSSQRYAKNMRDHGETIVFGDTVPRIGTALERHLEPTPFRV
jgi:hypothetical protein